MRNRGLILEIYGNLTSGSKIIIQHNRVERVLEYVEGRVFDPYTNLTVRDYCSKVYSLTTDLPEQAMIVGNPDLDYFQYSHAFSI